MAEEAAKAKTLSKTLTFGLGVALGWDKKRKAPTPLDDAQRKLVYELLIRASKAIGQACNLETAKRYAREILGVPKEQADAFKPSNPILRERIDDCDWIAGGCLSQAYKLTDPHFQGQHKKDLLYTGKRNLPHHRTDGTHPIPFRKTETRLAALDGERFLCVEVFKASFAKDNGIPNWLAFPVVAKKRDRVLNAQLDRVMEGEWDLRNSRLRRNPRGRLKWEGQIVVAYEPDPFKALDPAIVMGIDLGVNVPAAVHIRGPEGPQPWAMMVGNGRQMLASRNVIRSEILRIVRGLRTKDSALVGPARDAARERLRDLRKKERRVLKTASQRVAAQIAEAARRNGAGTWQVEALGGDIKEDIWLKRNWAPQTLLDAVRWNAQKLGAEIVEVDPRYTSQRCSKCGHIDAANRPKAKKGQAEFRCVACGHHENADKNAARNLSTPGIADLISAAKPPKE